MVFKGAHFFYPLQTKLCIYMVNMLSILLSVFVLADVLQHAYSATTYCDNNCVTDGYYCVQGDPQAFSVCLGGARVGTLRCQTGLVWDIKLKLCNWPSAIVGTQCPCTTPTTAAPTTSGPTTVGTTTKGTPGTTRPSAPAGMRRVCYYTNWAVYRSGPASYGPGHVDPFMCTHLIIAFMNLNNGIISFSDPSDGPLIDSLTKLRNKNNTALKILIAIGGWNAGSWPFMQVVANSSTITSFISNAISFLRQYDLDGLDIDWEYPLGYIPQFTQLMAQLRSTFESEAIQTAKNRLLLSAAVAAGQSTIDYAYNVPALSNAVDFINLMSYDLNGAWNPTTGLDAGLYPQTSSDPFNVQWCSNYWIQKGADRNKMVIGIPTYSRTFKLCNPGPTQTGIGSKACGTGNSGPFTQSAGFEAYYESCLKLQCSSGNWTSAWSQQGQAPYMYSGNQWISYETIASIAAKVNWVVSQNFGGVMVWALDLDDFNDMCGSGIKSPLMATFVAASTGKPIPVANPNPKATVNACDPTGTGGGGSSGGGGSVTPGTNVDLSICDKNCAVDGIYCVPDNSQAFYKCLGGVRYALQYCQSTLMYNYKTSSCDWPASFPGCNCVIPSTTTTAAPVPAPAAGKKKKRLLLERKHRTRVSFPHVRRKWMWDY